MLPPIKYYIRIFFKAKYNLLVTFVSHTMVTLYVCLHTEPPLYTIILYELCKTILGLIKYKYTYFQIDG